MKRVSRPDCEEGPLFEEQESEGQRQLRSLLVQQLQTHVDIQRCVSKRQCFAPAALYCPFGAQAAGVRSLSQFEALQDGERELSALRDLGLTEEEIELWRNRDQADKSRGVCADPGATQQRLQQIRAKMAAHAELLSRPQRFNCSRALSRREMEIEQALYQGNDRQGYLSALFHRDEVTEDAQQVSTSHRTLDSVYREVLEEDRLATSRQNRKPPEPPSQTRAEETDQSDEPEAGREKRTDQSDEPEAGREERTDQSDEPEGRGGLLRLAAPTKIDLKQPISSLRAGSHALVTVRGDVEVITDDDISSNRESGDTIRSIPRFRNYQPGKPSKVLCVKNLAAQATVAQLVALFSRFERSEPVVYKLLTGRLRGQAFVTLSDVETAQKALDLLNGYRLLGKPMVVEFGRERQDSARQQNQEKDEK
uniref:RNA binding motif protein 41 n=1 Tax=Neogobius melanostomus TaxID=47308 RepID=A0A8C6SVT9_9GOBI